MVDKERVFNVMYIELVPARYEIQPKKISHRLVRKLIDKITNNYTTCQYSTLNLVMPEELTKEEVEKLVSYYLKTELDQIASEKLSKEEISQRKIKFVNFDLKQKLFSIGFRCADLSSDSEADSFAFVEKNKFKNNEFDNAEDWYDPNVTEEEFNAILAKLPNVKDSTIDN